MSVTLECPHCECTMSPSNSKLTREHGEPCSYCGEKIEICGSHFEGKPCLDCEAEQLEEQKQVERLNKHRKMKRLRITQGN